MLWIFATLVAASAQTARNAMQNSLTASLGTLGATQVRFVYGLPFALIFLGLVVAISGASVPAANGRFLVFTLSGAMAQIIATALLLSAMRERSFSVATAFTKTEAVQVAIFGLIILGDDLSVLRAVAILLSTAGVFLIAVKRMGSVHAELPRSHGLWLSHEEASRCDSFSSNTRKQQFLCGEQFI